MEFERSADGSSVKKLSDTILIGGERHKIEGINCKPGSGIIEYRVARR